MKRLFASAAVLATLASGLALSAAAQAPAAKPAAPATAGPAKIAVIAFQVAVAKTNEGQRDFSTLQKKYEPKQQALKTLNDQIEALKKQLQTQSATLSDADRASKTKEIDDKEKLLQRDLEDARGSMQGEMQDTYNSLAAKVYDVMETYAKQHGYTLVLDIAQQQTPVLYAADSTNITQAVIEAYNAKTPTIAPPAPGTPSAPAPKSPAGN
ncbi:MAG TPA: OmpH family outer membrane protein [Terracidiphilus sp.]|nr:OmpH family outer membrane protein [Terracidiphilus sp.]